MKINGEDSTQHEGGAARGARLLAVVVGEEDALPSDAVDVGRMQIRLKFDPNLKRGGSIACCSV